MRVSGTEWKHNSKKKLTFQLTQKRNLSFTDILSSQSIKQLLKDERKRDRVTLPPQHFTHSFIHSFIPTCEVLTYLLENLGLQLTGNALSNRFQQED